MSDSLGGAAPFWHPQNNDSGDYISASSTNSHYIPIDEEDEDSDIDSDNSGTVSPSYTVILYPVSSQLWYLVITTRDSIYGKKNSQIRYLRVLVYTIL